LWKGGKKKRSFWRGGEGEGIKHEANAIPNRLKRTAGEKKIAKGKKEGKGERKNGPLPIPFGEISSGRKKRKKKPLTINTLSC